MNENLEIELNKQISEFGKDSRIKECFHFEKKLCSDKIISAHSIQNNKVLNLLESEVNGNLKVLSFLYLKHNKFGKATSLKPIGKKSASTFFGFCNYHDTNIFKEIENNEIDLNNDKHCFLLSYRAFAKDYHAKKETLKGYKKNKFYSITHKLLGLNLAEGSEIGLRDSSFVKKRLNKIFEKKQFSELYYLTYELDYLIPIALSGSFNPNYSYKGKKLNKSSDINIIYEFVNFVVHPTISGKTLIILSCLPEHEKSVLFLDELDELKTLKFEKAVSSLAIAYIENTFISPILWEKLGVIGQEKLLNEIENTNPMNRGQYKGFFHSEINFFDLKFKKTAPNTV